MECGTIFLLIWIGTALWVLSDASSIGAGKGSQTGFFKSMGPGGWFFSVLLGWIVAFPAYLILRDEIKASGRDGGRAKAVPDPAPVSASRHASAPLQSASGTITELGKLAELQEKGIIDQAEFQILKARLLGQDSPPAPAKIAPKGQLFENSQPKSAIPSEPWVQPPQVSGSSKPSFLNRWWIGLLTILGLALIIAFSLMPKAKAGFDKGREVRNGPDSIFQENRRNVAGSETTQTLQSSIFAGTVGVPGARNSSNGDGQFRSPKGMACDGVYLYLADSGNHAIRKINLSSHEVTTLAGSLGQKGFLDGVGTDARFKSPSNLALVDQNLFVADSANHAIRSVNTVTGQVHTVVGMAGKAGKNHGSFSEASFYWPDGIAAWSSGLVVVDGNNHCIRFVDLNSRMVSPLAGQIGHSGFTDGLANRFQNPVGLSVWGDSAYIADYNNGRVRQLDLKGREVRTLNLPELRGPIGLFGGGNSLWIVDHITNSLVWVDPSNGKLRTILLHSTDPREPTGILMKPMAVIQVKNILYLSDIGKHVIRRIELGDND